MAIFPLLNKKEPILFRCTECGFEFKLSIRQVRKLEKKNRHDPVCPPKELCHICHMGFMIPVKYINKIGKEYLFHKIKPKIKNIDPNTALEDIFQNPDNEIIMFFPPDET